MCSRLYLIVNRSMWYNNCFVFNWVFHNHVKSLQPLVTFLGIWNPQDVIPKAIFSIFSTQNLKQLTGWTQQKKHSGFWYGDVTWSQTTIVPRSSPKAAEWRCDFHLCMWMLLSEIWVWETGFMVGWVFCFTALSKLKSADPYTWYWLEWYMIER